MRECLTCKAPIVLRKKDRKDRSYCNNVCGTVRGSAQPLSKLTEADVRKIKALRAKGVFCKDLAAEFGISITQVSKIANGLIWRHVV